MGAPNEQLQAQIRELEARITETNARIDEVRSEKQREEREYARYREKYHARYSAQKADIDTLKQTEAQLRRRADSLASAIGEVRVEQTNQQRRRAALTRRLGAYSDSLTALLAMLPPSGNDAGAGAVAFLRGEMATGTVDNVEALERLWHVFDELTNATQSVEVFKGPSPLDGVAGQVDFIRLGHAYLACVDQQGTHGALWIPVVDSAGRWLPIENTEHLSSLRACVRIRQGSMVPSLVNMPFNHEITLDTLSQGGE